MGEKQVHIHHMSKPRGEQLDIRCPHCRKAISVSFKTLQLDEDTVVFGYGKKTA